jgi:hypothetical protein
LSGAGTSKAAEKRAEEARLIAMLRGWIPRGSTIYYITEGRGMHVRFFICRSGEVHEISGYVAKLGGQRYTTSGWVAFSGGGYSAAQEGVSTVARKLYDEAGALRYERA